MRAVLKVRSATPLSKLVLPASQAAQTVGAFEDGDGSPRAGELGNYVTQCALSLASTPQLSPNGWYMPPFPNSIPGAYSAYHSQVPIDESQSTVIQNPIEQALVNFFETKNSALRVEVNAFIAEAIRKCPELNNLSQNHLCALVVYSSHGFDVDIRSYRQALSKKEEKSSAEKVAFERLEGFVPVLQGAILEAIQKLPRVQPLNLYRATTMSLKMINKIIKDGCYIVPNKIQSATLVPLSVNARHNVCMVIGRSKKSIIKVSSLGGLTKYPEEQEHFLIPGTYLQLEAVQEENIMRSPGEPEGLHYMGSEFPDTTLYFQCTYVPPQETMS